MLCKIRISIYFDPTGLLACSLLILMESFNKESGATSLPWQPGAPKANTALLWSDPCGLGDPGISLDVRCQDTSQSQDWATLTPSAVSGKTPNLFLVWLSTSHHVHSSLLFLLPGRPPRSRISTGLEKHSTGPSACSWQCDQGAGCFSLIWFLSNTYCAI